MQGQSSPVQAKDPYTGSIMHVGSFCNYTGVYNVHLPRIIRNWLMGVTRKQKQKACILVMNDAVYLGSCSCLQGKHYLVDKTCSSGM